MSSSKVKQLTRTITVNSYSWATNVLTLNMAAGHGLITGDTISFVDQEHTNPFSGTITVDTNTITVPCTNRFIRPPNRITTGIWNNGAAGAQEAFSFGWASQSIGLIQVSSNSTGTVTVKCEGSLDGVKWVDASGAAQAVVANSSVMLEITKPYVYGRLNFTVAVGGVSGQVTAIKTVV